MRRTRTTLAALATAVGLAALAGPAAAQQGNGLHDSGWAPPARVPVYRVPVEYQRYYPKTWYGSPGGSLPAQYPVTYVPTDTMQLGYYWQRVPSWQPRPGMLPAPPRPDQWMMRQHQFANPPMMYNMTYRQWCKQMKRGMPPQGTPHGPAVTPIGYGHPVQAKPFPKSESKAEDSKPEDPNAATDKTALAPFLTR